MGKPSFQERLAWGGLCLAAMLALLLMFYLVPAHAQDAHDNTLAISRVRVTLPNTRVLTLNASFELGTVNVLHVMGTGFDTASNTTKIQIVGGAPRALVSTLPVLATCNMPAPSALLGADGSPLLDANGGKLLASGSMCLFDWPVSAMVTGNNQLGTIVTLANNLTYTVVSYIGKPVP